DLDVMVFPPFTLLAGVAAQLQSSAATVGAQDLSEHGSGAYTGEVSGAMLAEAGCTHVLVGHSERRQLHGEDDALVGRKFMAAQAAGLVPVLCVGESLAEREGGRTEMVVGRQLAAVVAAA